MLKQTVRQISHQQFDYFDDHDWIYQLIKSLEVIYIDIDPGMTEDTVKRMYIECVLPHNLPWLSHTVGDFQRNTEKMRKELFWSQDVGGVKCHFLWYVDICMCCVIWQCLLCAITKKKHATVPSEMALLIRQYCL